MAVQIVAGIVGGLASATAVHEHSFGALGHMVAGTIGGGLSGYFLQTLAATVVSAGDSINELTLAEQIIA